MHMPVRSVGEGEEASEESGLQQISITYYYYCYYYHHLLQLVTPIDPAHCAFGQSINAGVPLRARQMHVRRWGASQR